MPGPPREMRDMFEKGVKPYLEKYSKKKFISKYVRFYGIGESLLETKIKDIMDRQTNPTLALYAKTGEVLLRITASSENKIECEEMINRQLEEIERRERNRHAKQGESDRHNAVSLSKHLFSGKRGVGKTDFR